MAGAGSAVGATVRVLLLATLVLAGCVAAISWLTGGSPSGRARREVQSLFVDQPSLKRTARVDSCDQIAANADARIYLCDVVVTSCTRIFRFAVLRGFSDGAMPVSASPFELHHPCSPAHS